MTENEAFTIGKDRYESGRGGRFLLVLAPIFVALLLLLAPAAQALEPVHRNGAKPALGSESSRSGPSEFRVSIAPGRYIVVLEKSVQQPGAVAHRQVRALRGNLGFVYHLGFRGYAASGLSKADVDTLRSDPLVKYVVPDRKVKVLAQTAPTGVSRISATTNPGLDIDGIDDVRVDADVAIIDTGIDYTHSDLNVAARTNCVPATEEGVPICVDNSGTDGDGHGTHVAGIVGALDNQAGVVGVAPGARLWAVRVLNDKGEGYESWINAGVEWVTAHANQIEVANMSLGGFGNSPSQTAAVEASINAGVVYTVAAGNYAYNSKTQSPANVPGAITVSALADYDGQPGGKTSPNCASWGADDTLAVFSDWGSSVDLAAPGACIYSTWRGNSYAFDSGTSMAAPHAAGAAAYLASVANPGSRLDVETIARTLVNAGSLEWSDTSEDGKVEPLLYLGGTALTQTEAATGGATTLDGRSAVLSGAINPRGRETTYKFEYGTTTSYGSSAPATPGTVSATAGYTPVSERIEGLVTGQTYHYRLVATNSSGTALGKDQTLTTSRWESRSATGSGAEEEWLSDVSCPSATWCMGVSHFYGGGANRAGSYQMAGEQWQFTEIPSPAGGYFPAAEGVSCTSSAYCIAVGSYVSGGIVVPLAVRWNGSRWALQSIPAPTGAQYSTLNKVSCSASSNCIAVGYYKNAAGTWVNYSTRWNGSTWTTLETPNSPGSTESELDDISCFSGSCTAVGWYVKSGVRPVIAKWNGSTWSLGTPARLIGTLRTISCASETSCLATGGEMSAESWNGTSWSNTAAAAIPSGMTRGAFTDVSCPAAGYCTAVGYYYKGERYLPLVEVWNGSTWRSEPAARNDETSDELLAISCIGLNRCVGVGGATEAASMGLIEERREVVTDAASNVRPTAAVLNGRVNPGATATTYRFEYGPTTSYGSKSPVPDGSAGTGSESVNVSQEVSGLRSETTYHARLAATNSKGTSYGGDITFRTASSPPVFVKNIGTYGSGNGQLKTPLGADVDASGNVWVADSGNNRIEKFNANGEYVGQVGTTGTGNGQFRHPADVAILPSGEFLVADAENNRIQKFKANGEYVTQWGVEGPGPGQFYEPQGVAVAPGGEVWVTDSFYYRVQEFTAGGAFIREVHGAGQGGSGPAEFWHPVGIDVDPEGHVWVADSRNNRVQELSSNGAFIRAFGTAGIKPGQFYEPSGIDVKPSGNVLVTDDSRVQEFTPTGEFVREFGKLFSQGGIVFAPGGLVFVTDSLNHHLQKWQQPTAPEATTKPASAVKASQATLAGEINPAGLETKYRFEYGLTASYGSSVPVPDAVIAAGTSTTQVSKTVTGLVAGSTYHYRIVASNEDGVTTGKDQTFQTESIGPTFVKYFGAYGSGNGQLKIPQGADVDASGNVWVADSGNNRIEKFNANGEYIGQFGTTGTGNGQFRHPADVAILPSGEVLVADAENNRIQRFKANGEYVTQWGVEGSGPGQFYEPLGVAVAPGGEVWVTDSLFYRVQEFTAGGAFIREVHGAGYGGNGPAEFSYPVGIDVDAEGHVWVVDSGNSRVQELSATGAFIRALGTFGSKAGQFTEPTAIDVKPSGNVLVTDKTRVQEFTQTGEFLEEFGAGKIFYAEGIAFAPSGLIYVSDSGNNRMQKWQW